MTVRDTVPRAYERLSAQFILLTSLKTFCRFQQTAKPAGQREYTSSGGYGRGIAPGSLPSKVPASDTRYHQPCEENEEESSIAQIGLHPHRR